MRIENFRPKFFLRIKFASGALRRKVFFVVFCDFYDKLLMQKNFVEFPNFYLYLFFDKLLKIYFNFYF